MDIQSISNSLVPKKTELPEKRAERAEESTLDSSRYKDKTMSASETDEMVKKLKSVTQGILTEISFSIDRDIDRVIVKITNTKTKEVLRQIPPEEVVALARRLKEHGEEAKGVIFSKEG